VFKNPAGRPAGLLLDEAGCKGMRIGDIEVSRKHANFFINRGGGSADDFLALMEKTASRVRDAFGVELEPEIKVVGRC
jgi:UDP-N-acetylmuramate dehydrogenase